MTNSARAAGLATGEGEEIATDVPRRRWAVDRRRRWLLEGVAATATALAATAIAIVALRAWRLDVRVPLSYHGDALLNLGWVQNVLETGWYLEAPRLNAPFGQEHHDYPLGPDQLHFVILRALTVMTGDATASVNLFYLLGFPLAALAAYWAMRRLHVPVPVAALGGVLFATLPYHFLRGTVHLFLSSYETVPLGCFLVLATAEGRPLFGLGRRLAFPRGRSALAALGTVALTALVASGGGYYAALTLVLLAPATLIGALRRRSRLVLLSGVLVSLLIVAFLALNSLPTLQYQLANGGNPDVPVRDEIETERHGLRPVTLLLPVAGHRLEPLADLARRYASFPTAGERGESLGAIGAAGLVLILVVAVGAVAGAFARGARWRRHRLLAALVVVCLVLGVIGGASSLFALLLSPQIRAWARISIFIGFFSLLAVCLVLGWGWRRARSPGARAIAVVALAGLLGVGALDQTSNRFIPDYAGIADRFAGDRAFIASMEAMFPPGAAIFQLPYRPYPEAGRSADSPDYEPMRGYIHSDALRFSYGGIKGREAGWQQYVHVRRFGEALPLVAAAGFSGVWVDRDAYADGGAVAESQLRSLLGVEPFVSGDGRDALYDLRPYATELAGRAGDAAWLAARQALEVPVWPRWQSGVRRPFVDNDGISRPAAGRVTLILANDGAAGREVVVSVGVAAFTDTPDTVEISWPDGSIETVAISRASTVVTRTIFLAAGDNRVELSTDAPPVVTSAAPEPPRMWLNNLWVVDGSLRDLSRLGVALASDR